MDTKAKGGFLPIILIMMIPLVVAGFWDKIPAIKNSIHFILDPSLGKLLSFQLEGGMILIVIVLSFITTILRKYTTNQKELIRIREEHKALQEEIKKARDNPTKMAELNQKIMPLTLEQMRLSMQGTIFTGIPIILLFRWFIDFFTALGNPQFFGFFSWFWFYFIFTIIATIILNKVFKVV